MIGCLVIHGYTGGPYEVEPLTTYLKKHTDWKVVVPTLKGHGRDLDLKDVTFEKWIDDAVAAYKQLEKECDIIYIVGFSMGGMIASYLTAQFPVNKLVLLAPARRFISVKYLSHYFGEMIGDGIKGKLKENDMYLQLKEKAGDIPIKANLEFIRLVNFTKPHLEKIEVPVFIAQGKRDEMVPYRSAYVLEEEIASKEKEIVFFEQSDHHICLGNDQDVLNVLVLKFLQEDAKSKQNNNITEKEESSY